ncbi:MAG: AbrB family transcriptional regulator [Hyphomicrobiales bacterium]|nr:AbrB family transcriptional regulator [Hyphomicrobiales bacterium]
MFACLAAALAGAPLKGFGQFGILMRTILGVAIGASITPEFFGRLHDIGGSLAFTPIFVVVIGLTGYPYFRRLCGFSRVTAYYSAMPGGLQDMLVFGEEAGGDVKALGLVHATRILVIVTIMPFLLDWIYGISVAGRPVPGLPVADTDAFELVMMAFAAIVGWKGGEAIKLFGASIVGPLIVTAILSLAGVITHRPPMEAIIAAQLFIGIAVGVKYTGASWHDLRTTVIAALGYCALLALIAFIFSHIVTGLGLAPPLEALIAYAPGGQAEMAVLAIVAGADVPFVVAHHITRIVLVILGAPVVARRFRSE